MERTRLTFSDSSGESSVRLEGWNTDWIEPFEDEVHRRTGSVSLPPLVTFTTKLASPSRGDVTWSRSTDTVVPRVRFQAIGTFTTWVVAVVRVRSTVPSAPTRG